MTQNLIIRKCTISEIENASNIDNILKEYAEESSVKKLPSPLAKADTYKHLESLEAIHIVGAFVNKLLVGYIISFAPVMPHYSSRIAVTESFFVLKEYRKTGAGLKLLKEAEQYSINAEAIGLFVSAPIGGVLAEVLPNVGYEETNRVFFKRFSNE